METSLKTRTAEAFDIADSPSLSLTDITFLRYLVLVFLSFGLT